MILINSISPKPYCVIISKIENVKMTDTNYISILLHIYKMVI